MKKVLIWISVLVLVAVLSVVGTLAYLTAVDEETNVMTVGDASIKILEYERVDIDDKNDAASVQAFNDNKHLRPTVVADGFNYANSNYNTPLTDNYVIWDEAHVGEEIKINGAQNYQTPIWNPDDITNEIDKMVFVKNTGDCNVYIRLCFAFEAGNYVRLDRFNEMVHMNKNETDWAWDWVEPQENHITEIDGTRCFIAWATYKYPVAPDELTKISLSQIALDFSAINDHARAFGDTYDVKVFAQGIQSDGFTADLGYTPATAITEVFGTTVPFDGVTYVPLTDLRTALHYLDADTSKTKLVGTDNASNNMVNSVTFGLTADHAEKVKDYKGIFMANNAGEADFTAYAYYVPNGDKYDIYVLADDWKIYAPANCSQLFIGMSALTEVDTSNLDVSQTTSMYRMFFKCQSLTTLEVGNWFAKGTDEEVVLQQAFYDCKALKNLDVSNWIIKTNESLKETFKNCSSLSGKLDLTGWDVSGITLMQYTFSGCTGLTEIDVSNWNVGNVSDFSYMFENCYSLNKLDVANWDVSSATNFHGLFSRCSSLKRIELSEWNVEKLSSALGMFVGCGSLTSLDLSGWNTANLVKTEQMFSKCGNLKTIYVGKDIWNMESVTDSTNMFEQCVALVGEKGTIFNSGKTNVEYAHIDGGTSNPGYLTEK